MVSSSPYYGLFGILTDLWVDLGLLLRIPAETFSLMNTAFSSLELPVFWSQSPFSSYIVKLILAQSLQSHSVHFSNPGHVWALCSFIVSPPIRFPTYDVSIDGPDALSLFHLDSLASYHQGWCVFHFYGFVLFVPLISFCIFLSLISCFPFPSQTSSLISWLFPFPFLRGPIALYLASPSSWHFSLNIVHRVIPCWYARLLPYQ